MSEINEPMGKGTVETYITQNMPVPLAMTRITLSLVF
jgi:hypothetical protein